MDGRDRRSGRRLCRADGAAVRFRSAPRRCSRRFPVALRRACTRSPGLMRKRSSKAARAPRRAPWSTASRCPISAATIPTPTRPMRRSDEALFDPAGAGFRRRLGRRRRPQHDGRPGPRDLAERQPRRARRQRAARARLQGRAARASRARCRPAARSIASPPRSASIATRRRRAGSSSATCSTPAIALCGEESAGTGSDHIREKDGVWAVLFWLNILAARREPAAAILREHWRHYGRNYYARHDYEGVRREAAARLMDGLRAASPTLPGRRAGVTVPPPTILPTPIRSTDRSRSAGHPHAFGGGSRIVFRLSAPAPRARRCGSISSASSPTRPGIMPRRTRSWRRSPRRRLLSPTFPVY